MTELPDRLLRDALDHTASAAPSPACVDPGSLAAWADGTMTSADRATLEAHAAGCARCLALLAAMTRTEPQPTAPAWWRRSPIAWLLPLAAMTAGLVIVVRLAVLEQRSAASLPTTAARAVAPPRLGAAQPAATPAQPPQASVAPRAPAPTSRQKHEPVEDDARRAAPASREAAAKNAAAPTDAAPAPAAVPTPAAPAPPAGGLAAPASAGAALAPAPQAPLDAVTSAAGTQVAGGRGGAGAFAARIAAKAAGDASRAPIVITSPDRDSVWRIVGGTVEHTADGGATWQPQAVGAATSIRAGAAPEARVCWLAGAAGVVLRTIDGTTWTRMTFPEPADLVAIQASDASHATVTDAAGRRFATNDGGATWTVR
jgi:Putative zinc-finger